MGNISRRNKKINMTYSETIEWLSGEVVCVELDILNRGYADESEQNFINACLTAISAMKELMASEEKLIRVGSLVKMNDKYYMSEENRNKVFEVVSEPRDLCGTMVVKLKGFPGAYALDGLTKNEK